MSWTDEEVSKFVEDVHVATCIAQIEQALRALTWEQVNGLMLDYDAHNPEHLARKIYWHSKQVKEQHKVK